ncbi:MAG: hypothetical protein EFKGCFLK_01895 [Rhodocyclaceae bacterium]|nr:hypothetical protein [Rhodocyclaceae bacterium]CAG0931540.1 hypothetical protein RHDC3_01895 [Rhodocyclaceae bacterium]
MGADFTPKARGRRPAMKLAVLAALAALLVGLAGRDHLPAAAAWAARQPLDIALLIIDAYGKSKEAADKPARDEPGRQDRDRREWLDALLRLLREPVIELRDHCGCQP